MSGGQKRGLVCGKQPEVKAKQKQSKKKRRAEEFGCLFNELFVQLRCKLSSRQNIETNSV